MVLLDAPPALGVLESLEALPVDEMTASALGAVLQSVGSVRGRVDAFEARALAAFDRLGGAKAEGATDTGAWLADRTKTSARDAKRSVQRAAAVDALPALGSLLAAGSVSAAHVDAIGSIVPEKLLSSASPLVEVAKSSTPEQLRQKAHKFVADADGDGGASRSEKMRAKQSLVFFDADSGMGALHGEWAPEHTASIEKAVDLVADELWRAEHPKRNPQRWDATTLKYRRADALYQLAQRVLARSPLVTSADPVDEVDEDVELTTAIKSSARAPKPLALLLVDYQTARAELALKGVCELGDGTPVSPDTMRRLLCDAAIIPTVLGSRGEVLDQGRKIYLPTMAQRRAVFIRDRHCMFPGCKRPAKWSDVHHIVWWETGGRTDYDNLLLLCGTHHHLVHEGGWRLTGTAYDFTIHRPDGELWAHIARGPP